jgi:hypothetical protein
LLYLHCVQCLWIGYFNKDNNLEQQI